MKGERIEEECEGVGMGPGSKSEGKDEREVVGIYFKGIHDGRVNSFSRGSLASSQITGPLIRAQTRITGGGMQKDVKDGHKDDKKIVNLFSRNPGLTLRKDLDIPYETIRTYFKANNMNSTTLLLDLL
ncbi:hypothetical protein ALC56_03839 [Trachymyrmex septentrionalis]|uniref:Uncharacterized protein n=1 Tax=Trachymyrmex septentrionalis TaxID=34720 RepID=A0A195FMR9_9HYME|nr:hypothetical protein ALC56_03839 [Trachymyrmex septentrionalis]